MNFFMALGESVMTAWTPRLSARARSAAVSTPNRMILTSGWVVILLQNGSCPREGA